MSRPEVLVSLVTFNSAGLLERCLDSVEAQSISTRVAAWDNASEDDSARVLERRGIATLRSPRNVGFCRAHNQLLKQESFEYVLLLNPDVVLEPDYLKILIGRMQSLERVGTAGGKLLRMDEGGRSVQRNGRPVLDSSGMYFTPTLRHFDRGSQEVDRGQYDRPQFVFGITGAALLCSRAFVEDVALGDEFLDEDFFAYREDADLAWRGQLRGWKALYEPAARGFHERSVLPRRRSEVKASINYHSVKNRFLMRAKNIDFAVRLRCFPHMYLRDLGALLYILLREHGSFGALREARGLRKKMERKRRRVQETRLVPPRKIAWWFSFRPRAFDLSAAAEEGSKRS